ncbi:MAG: hypothetical protein ACKPKO_20865, partial [Candidatus Fonsibacter sp.]
MVSSTADTTYVDNHILDFDSLQYLNNALIQMDALIRDEFYDKIYINGLITNSYTNTQVYYLLEQRQPTISSLTNQSINKLICNDFEPTTENTDMIIKANKVIIWDTITHTLLSGVASHFYTESNFYQYIRAKTGFESGYDNGYDIFTSTFILSKTGNGYINGNFGCGGLLTAPNIYNKTPVDNLVSGKQNALIFRDPTQLNLLVQGLPLLGGGNIVTGISVVPPLSLTYHGHDYIEI